MPAPSKATAWVAIACAFIGGAEGLRTVVYLDPVGIPTGCFGDTEGVRAGMTWTPQECSAKLGDKLTRVYGPGVDGCTPALPPYRKASYVSLAYNIGVAAFCGSSVVKLELRGDVAGACGAILLYNKMRVGGQLVYSPGLANRRERERALCMKDLPTLPSVALWASALAGPSRAGAPGPSWKPSMPITLSAMPRAVKQARNRYAMLPALAIN